ncbi:hypothetical protein ACFX15_007670 [Malus domestica]
MGLRASRPASRLTAVVEAFCYHGGHSDELEGISQDTLLSQREPRRRSLPITSSTIRQSTSSSKAPPRTSLSCKLQGARLSSQLASTSGSLTPFTTANTITKASLFLTRQLTISGGMEPERALPERSSVTR